MKLLALVLASVLALGACASKPPVPARQQVSEITVNTDLSSIGNRRAVNYWSTLGTDLKVALASEFVSDIAPSGAVLTVDVDELSLANAYTSKFAGENSTLRGLATLTRDGKVVGSYNVTASSSQAMQYLPPQSAGTVVSPDSADFYAALVSAFARGVYAAVQNPQASAS